MFNIFNYKSNYLKNNKENTNFISTELP